MMTNELPPERNVAVATLLLLPPKVRTSVLEDDALRRQLSLGLDAVIKFEKTGTEFARSELFRAVRHVLTGASSESSVVAQDGTTWRVSRSNAGEITVGRDAEEVSFSEFACFSSDVGTRVQWFDQQTAKLRIMDDRTRKWREILTQRALDDEELGHVLDEFRLTPAHAVAAIEQRFRRRKFSAADLVPPDLRYFDRLVGELGGATNVRDFVSTVVAPRLRALIDENAYEGLKTAFALSSYHAVSEVIDLNTAPRGAVGRVFQWIQERGDRISQVGAIECGLRHLDAFPEIEESLAEMTRAIAADDPEDARGRLHVISGLVALVEGEIARRRIARRRPPFWRRLAAIAHAALIEREVLAAHLEPGSVADWSLKSGGALYYIQTLIDLRQEPRWFPDFISPQQLKAEFVSRVAGAAERHREKVGAGELASLLTGQDPNSIQSQRVFPAAFLPGPLEGGLEALIEIPAEFERSIKTNLEAEELTAESFFGLVNSSLIFRVGTQLSDLAAEGLRRVGYQLRKMHANDDPFPLLHGLAMVSAVTRSRALADEVRVLARAARRRPGSTLSPEAVARIALVAAASNKEFGAWSNFLGDWLAELAFADMSMEQASGLQGDLHTLLHIEPLLWETCGRAEAALSAFIESFPEEPAQSNETTE
jgi:hypothetical protein